MIALKSRQEMNKEQPDSQNEPHFAPYNKPRLRNYIYGKYKKLSKASYYPLEHFARLSVFILK